MSHLQSKTSVTEIVSHLYKIISDQAGSGFASSVDQEQAVAAYDFITEALHSPEKLKWIDGALRQPSAEKYVFLKSDGIVYSGFFNSGAFANESNSVRYPQNKVLWNDQLPCPLK